MAILGSIAVASFAAGSLAGAAGWAGPVAWMALAVASGSIALVAPRACRIALVLTCWSAAAAAHGASAREAVLHSSLAAWFEARAHGEERLMALSRVTGVLAEDARVTPAGVRLAIDVSQIEADRRTEAVSGRISLYVAGDLAPAQAEAWTAGRQIRASASLRRAPVAWNFGAISPARQALARGYLITGTIKSAGVVEIRAAELWHEAVAAARAYVRHAAAAHVAPHDVRAAALVTAVLIGDRAGLDPDVERQLQAAGTYHVVAISGGNVALLAMLCYALLRAVVRSPRGSAVATIACLLMYGWLVGDDPSVARAITAAVVFLAASAAGLRPPAFGLLRIAGVLVLLMDPLMVIDPGAWLSFGATFGIIAFTRALTDAVLRRPAAAQAWPPARATLTLAIATVAAEAIVWPIGASVFGRISLVSVAMNLVAIPAMAVIQTAGLAVVAAAGVAPAAATIAGAAAAVAAQVLVGSSALVDDVVWATRRVPAPAAWLVVSYYAAVAAAWLWPGGRRGRLAPAAVGGALLVAMAAAPGAGVPPASGRLRVTALDVGQGESVLVQLPDGHALLVDAGGSPGPFDIGGRIVIPAAHALGARSLQWLALSHGDRDHVGGAAAVIRDMGPREIWEGVPVPRDAERARLRILAASRGAAWRTVQAGARVDAGDVVIEARHPPAPEWERQRVRNDDSLVLRIRYRDVEFWLTGDSGAEFERGVVLDSDAAAIRVLKVGHHGSRTSTSDGLVATIRPQIAVISVGRGNLFGHPAPDVVDRLTAAGAAVFRTDRDGAVVLETDGSDVLVRTARGRTWSFGVRRRGA